MSTSRSWHRPSTKSLVTIILTVIVAAAALIYFLPHENKFGYSFETGKPWRYARLIADFNFPILKSGEQVEHERDSVISHFKPYFALDSTKCERYTAEMLKSFNNGEFGDMPAYYLPRLRELLGEMYRRGIIDATVVDSLRQAGINSVRLVRGSAAKKCPSTNSSQQGKHTRKSSTGTRRERHRPSPTAESTASSPRT